MKGMPQLILSTYLFVAVSQACLRYAMGIIMKKVTAFLLCILMCLMMIPIPNADAASSFKVQVYNQNKDTANNTNTLVWGVEPDTANVIPTVTPTPTISPLIPELEIAEYDVPDNNAMQFVEDMKLGWNLGNAFDAYNCDWVTDELEYEAAWCGAYTTKELMDTLKETGFKTIRIPVSWHDHVSGNSFEISEAWMNRVQEVVNYCIDNDMYVIINMHHDVDTAYYYPSTEYLENSRRYVSYIWTQIAERFAEYDEHLIFEGINEPRLVGHTIEWWIDLNNTEVVDSLLCINELNQVFVDTVRATGGKNASRYLMCSGYCASADGATNTYFKLPTDISGNNKLIISVHAYTPYSFALDKTGTGYWSVNDQTSVNSVNEFLDMLYNKYTSQGIPVVIGEFGALDKNGNLQSRVEYASYYIAAARARGIRCLWWDNNAFTGEGELFGLINRSTYEFEYPEIVQGMMIYAGGDETSDESSTVSPKITPP